jgi:FAD/FMN-containing dehydrogenase
MMMSEWRRMDISGYVDRLRADLVAAAASGGEAMVDAAERLVTTLDAAVRMALLEALSDAAAEISAELDGGAVEVRLKGRDPQFVVIPPPAAAAAGDAAEADVEDEADGVTVRITLRLPENVKQRVEEAATRSRQSLNTWLVEAARAAAREPASPREWRVSGQRLSGWAR